jgi:hypothetical protein
MCHDILCIGSVDFSPDEVSESFSADGADGFILRRAATMEEAEPYVYENRVCLVIADTRKIRCAFSQGMDSVIPEEDVPTLLSALAIPEEETELTVVFADIKGFTGMTQHMQPRDVIRTLNTVFDIATRIIYEDGGDIDKFIGDAFFAVYRDPRAAITAMTTR